MSLFSVGVTGLIGIAGAFGALARYLLGRFVARRVSPHFPSGTLLINVSGSFLIGLFFVATARHFFSPIIQSVLSTGFLGGYTTFSTMSWEGVQLIRGGDYWMSLLYLLGSVLLGIVAVVAGLGLGWII